MLNGQKLILSPDGDLPIISPKVRISNQLITIPSQCVFFLVLPDIKSKACMAVQIEESKESYKNGVRILDQEEFDETDYSSPILDQEDELVSNEKQMYVAFRPKYIKTNDESVVEREVNNIQTSQPNNDGSPNIESLQQSEPLVKYVTFSNNNWLSKFPKTLNNREYSNEPSTFPSTETATIETQTELANPPPPKSRREKYHILAQAVAGRRHAEKNLRSDIYSSLDSAISSLKPSQKLKLIKRSIDETDYNSKELDEIIKEFTNKEILPLDQFSKTDKSTSETPFKPDGDSFKTHDRIKKEYTIINTEVPKVQQSELTSQTLQTTMITSTPPITTSAIDQHHAKHESHVQKIKTRAEQALAKVHEKTSQKIRGRKQQDKFKNEVKDLTVQHSIIEKPMITSIKSITENSMMSSPKSITGNSMVISAQSITTNTELPSNKNLTNLADNIRYNRQTNSSSTDGIKIARPRINLKSKKYINLLDVENAKTTPISHAPITEITNFEPSITEMPTKKTTKLRSFTYIPKTLSLTKPKVIDGVEIKNGKTLVRESRETTILPITKIKIKPVLHPLGRVRTPPNVVLDQIVTNEKITEKMVENLMDGKKILQSEQIVSPIDKNEESKLESKTSLSAATKLKALEEKLKIRRIEIEQRLHQKIHKAKRSLKNGIVEDDIMDINYILNADRSNELDIDGESDLKREIIRYPRSVADFTVKLNEVNTYVDKNNHDVDPKNNEVPEDSNNLTDRKNKNEMKILSEDSGFDNLNIKFKRKSVLEDVDEDDYSKTTIVMVNKLFSHMQTFWKYLKKTFQF